MRGGSCFRLRMQGEKMSNRTSIILSFILIALAVLAGVILYARLPDPMPSHWNAAGQVDDYMPKFWGIFLVPLMTIVLVPLFLVIPSIDPLKANIAKFRGIYNWFIVLFVVFMLFVYGLTLAAGLGYQFNMTLLLLPVVGLLFIGVGYMMTRAKAQLLHRHPHPVDAFQRNGLGRDPQARLETVHAERAGHHPECLPGGERHLVDDGSPARGGFGAHHLFLHPVAPGEQVNTIIEVNGLERSFGPNLAVDGMTFHVKQGEVFGLLGPNGAGKTTTVRLLNGILPPSGGTARVFGLDPATDGQRSASRPAC